MPSGHIRIHARLWHAKWHSATFSMAQGGLQHATANAAAALDRPTTEVNHVPNATE